jgi:hypothetical protein
LERGPFGKNSPVVFTSSVPAITGGELEQCPQCVIVDDGLTKAERPRRHQIRHSVRAGVGADSDSYAVTETERKHPVHKLAACGMAE